MKSPLVQGGSNMAGTDLCVNKPNCAAAVQCGLFTYKSVPVIFEPPCIKKELTHVVAKLNGNTSTVLWWASNTCFNDLETSMLLQMFKIILGKVSLKLNLPIYNNILTF